MRSSALFLLLPFFTIFASGAPHDHPQAESVEEDDSFCEQVWGTVVGPQVVATAHEPIPENYNQATEDLKSSVSSESLTSAVLPSVPIRIGPGSGGEKGHGPPPAPTSGATGSPSAPVPSSFLSGVQEVAKKQPEETDSTTAISTSMSAALTSAMSVASSSTPASTPHGGKYLFTALVTFGDNLSDNGNGSVAHHVAQQGQPNNNIYGFGTWINGPVVVSYLTDMLQVPMNQEFAFGHAWVSSDFGATVDDTIAQSNFSKTDTPYFSSGEFGSPSWGAPSAKLQVQDYVSCSVDKNELHLLWIGTTTSTLTPSVPFKTPSAKPAKMLSAPMSLPR